MNNRVRKIAVTGVLSALTAALGLSGLGFIRIGVISLTILHTPVIIGAILEGHVVGLVTGAFFGVFSLIQAALTAGGGDAAFVNPLISVLPRLFIGPVSYLVYRLIAGAAEKPRSAGREIAACAAGAVAGTVTNSALVLSAMALFAGLEWRAAGLIALANVPPEVAAAVVVVCAVLTAWKRIPRGGASRLSKEAQTK